MDLIDALRRQGKNASACSLGLRLVRRGCAIGLVALVLAAPAAAVERVLTIAAPAKAAPQQRLEVTVRASTDAGAKEQVGFLHVEFSLDDGKTWTGLCYEQNVGASAVRPLGLTTGAAGTKVIIRARAAYRGGAAGDVDFSGAAINWGDSWGKWATPPARTVTTEIVAR
jgi:hypothetical protein